MTVIQNSANSNMHPTKQSNVLSPLSGTSGSAERMDSAYYAMIIKSDTENAEYGKVLAIGIKFEKGTIYGGEKIETLLIAPNKFFLSINKVLLFS